MPRSMKRKKVNEGRVTECKKSGWKPGQKEPMAGSYKIVKASISMGIPHLPNYSLSLSLSPSLF